MSLVGDLSWFDLDQAMDGVRVTGEVFSSVRAYINIEGM